MAYKLTNITPKVSRLLAIVATKKLFGLYDQPVTKSVEKLDDLIANGITFEYDFELKYFEDLNAFTFDLQEIENEYTRWEKQRQEKLTLATNWYNTLTPEEQNYVQLLTINSLPKAH